MILIAFAIDTPDSLENVTVKVRASVELWFRTCMDDDGWRACVADVAWCVVDRGGTEYLRTDDPDSAGRMQGRPTTVAGLAGHRQLRVSSAGRTGRERDRGTGVQGVFGAQDRGRGRRVRGGDACEHVDAGGHSVEP